MQETWVQFLGRKIPWRREWLPTPVFLPGEFHQWRSLVAYNPWGWKESDMIERLAQTHTHPVSEIGVFVHLVFGFNLLLLIFGLYWVELINSVLLVSGTQQSKSVIHIHVSILQLFFLFRFLQSIEQSSLCYTIGPFWLSILNRAVLGFEAYETWILISGLITNQLGGRRQVS